MNRIEISNLALNAIGARSIASLEDDTSKEAKTMKMLYAPTMEEVLSLFDWPSVTKRERVAAVVERNLSKWEYKYRLPNDCITVLSMLSPEEFYEIDRVRTSRTTDLASVAIFEREGHYLLSNINPGIIKYIYFPEDAESLRDVLGAAVALRLAQNAAIQLGRDPSISSGLESRFDVALLRAKMAEGSDRRSDQSVKRNWSMYRGDISRVFGWDNTR